MESSKGDHHAQEGEQTTTTERHRSVLQEDLFIEGDIQGPGILEINGRLVGDIALDTVIVAAYGSLQGGIVARNLTVIGTVCGQVAAKSLAIKAQAVVQSDKIATNVLSVEEGASVNGTIRMQLKLRCRQKVSWIVIAAGQLPQTSLS